MTLFLYITLCTAITLYILSGVVLTLFQERLIYQPPPTDFYTCPALNEAEFVEHQSTRMYIWNKDKPLVVLYHGNGNSACDLAFLTPLITEAGYGYILVEYTGYAGDTHTPSHLHTKEDVHNVLSYIHEHQLIIHAIIGESLGSAVASYHTSITAPQKLILISPFTSIEAVARHRFWMYPVSLLVDNVFDSNSLLSFYTGETLVIHGTNDFIIPYSMGLSLYEHLAEPKTMIPVEGAGHINLLTFPEATQSITDFLSKEAMQSTEHH